MFRGLYNYTISYAKHPQALKVLSFFSFIEAIFWPVPVDVMIAPISFTKRFSKLKVFLCATLFSLLGGSVGYFLGFWGAESTFFNLIENKYSSQFIAIENLFDDYGIYVILIASFTPIPYKLFAISAGLFHMSFGLFLLTSFIGRGLRYALVIYFSDLLGRKYEDKIVKYIDIIGWVCVLLLILVYLLFKR